MNDAGHSSYSLHGKRVYVAGHRGMVGSSLVRRLQSENCEIITADSETLDLTDGRAVETFLIKQRPHAVFVAAARVGGIYANNSYPVEFLMENVAIAQNTIAGAFKAKVEKLLFLGSSCVYPRLAPQPIKEDSLLSGPLEPTNQWYALAKIAGIKMCEAYQRQYGAAFVSAMPTNLYGPGDNYHPEHSHVPAALIRRFHEAKEASVPQVTVWGTGTPRREFLYVDDLADGCVFMMKNYSGLSPLNIGTGYDITIAEFAELIRTVVGYDGKVTYDPSRPDGTPRKLLDTSRLTELGWKATTPLALGLKLAYAWYQDNRQRLRAS